MSNIVHDYIKNFIKLYSKSDYVENDDDFKLLDELEKFAKYNRIPISEIEVIKLIEVIARIKNVKNMLEIGTSIGYFSIYMSRLGGKITTIEKSQPVYEIASKNIKMAKKCNNILPLLGDAKSVMSKLVEKSKKFDLIYIDAAKSQYLEYFMISQLLINEGGVIISDNVLFKGLVASRENVQKYKTIKKKMKNYLDYLSKNQDFSTSLVSIGDGLAISVKI